MTHFINSVEKIICDNLTFDRFSSCAQSPVTNTFFLAMGISIIFPEVKFNFFFNEFTASLIIDRARMVQR